MEYLKAWIWKQEQLIKNGETIDTTLLKYVKKMFDELTGLVNTKLVRRTKTGNYELAELAELQTEIKFLKEIVADITFSGSTIVSPQSKKKTLVYEARLEMGSEKHKLWQKCHLEKYPENY